MPRFLIFLFFTVLVLPLKAQVPQEGPDARPKDRQDEDLPQKKVNIWDQLRERYDKNNDDRISSTEYERGETRFRRLDRNGDGVITAVDFLQQEAVDKSDKVAIYRPRAFAKVFEVSEEEPFKIDDLVVWFWLRDRNDDGVLSPQEMGAKGMPSKGRILRVFDQNFSADIEYGELLTLAEILDVNQDGLVSRAEVATKRLARGEGPAVGDVAPDFELSMKVGDEKVRLSSFCDDRPVALVFGSYT